MIDKEFSIKNMLNCFPQVEIEKYIFALLDENKQLEEENKQLKQENNQFIIDINRLQKELNDENLQCSKYAIVINDLKERIDKTIEYIEKHLCNEYIEIKKLEYILKILKGDNNENNK